MTRLCNYWYQDGIGKREKKASGVIERSRFETPTPRIVIWVEISWQVGATSATEVPKYLFCAPHLFYHFTELACRLRMGKLPIC